jgi:predicted ester cyclase
VADSGIRGSTGWTVAAVPPHRSSAMPQTPDVVVRRWFREVWDEGSESAIDQLMAPDARVHGLGAPGSPAMTGPEPFKQLFRTFRAALGDLEIAVERTIVQGDMCAAHCRVRGRHVGDALGGPATGQPVDFYGMTIARVQDGRIVEGWNCFEFLSMYQQIGWVQSPVLP